MVIDTDAEKPRLYLLQWLKSDRALMMLFNDGTFQVIKSIFSLFFIHTLVSRKQLVSVCFLNANFATLVTSLFLEAHLLLRFSIYHASG